MPVLYKEVKQSILEYAAQRRPHSRLPSRSELSKMFFVAKTTVDRAVKELVEEGYLYSLSGSGTYVADCGTNAFSLKKKEINAAVLLPNIMHDTYPGILRGVEDVMQSYGVNVVICNTDNDLERQESYLRRLIRSEVSGMIMIPTITVKDSEGLALSNMLTELDMPVVFCNRGIPGVTRPLIASNNFYGGYIATKHLLEMGYERIAFLSSYPYQLTHERFQGYQAALWENQREVDNALVRIEEKDNCAETGYEGARRLLENARPDAIFCFNDRLAYGVMNYFYEKNIAVGEEIGVVGYDNTPSCEMFKPGLTSVSYEEYENGRRAAEMLMEMILKPGNSFQRLTVTNPRLFVRGSSRRGGAERDSMANAIK